MADVVMTPGWERDFAEAVRPLSRRLADDILTDQRRLTAVRSGHLRDSNFVDIDEDDGTITAGNTAEYADFVERGTSRMHAQPYIRPAVTKQRGEYRA